MDANEDGVVSCDELEEFLNGSLHELPVDKVPGFFLQRFLENVLTYDEFSTCFGVFDVIFV